MGRQGLRKESWQMKRRLVRFLGGLVIGLVVAYIVFALLARPAADHPFFAHDGVLVMAHRGGRGLWPENTLYAFQRAWDLGVDVLEMDLHSTSDGALVIMHDDTVDRTTDGAGPIHEYTLDELKELDAGYQWTADDGATFPYRGQGITVPALEDVFEALPDARMNIEIKQAQPSIVAPLCELVRAYGLTERVLVASFDQETIRAFRQACPEVASTAGEDEVRVLYVLSRAWLARIYSAPAEAAQVPEYSGDLHVVTPRFLRAAHGRGMEVHVWTVNEPDDLQRMLDLGVDGIITDYPDRLLELLGR
jgi:glycerophosphoryl diester phosphodiesterase